MVKLRTAEVLIVVVWFATFREVSLRWQFEVLIVGNALKPHPIDSLICSDELFFKISWK